VSLWTNVVFPEPAIPRQMIQVGLSLIGVTNCSELASGAAADPSLDTAASAILGSTPRGCTHAHHDKPHVRARKTRPGVRYKYEFAADKRYSFALVADSGVACGGEISTTTFPLLHPLKRWSTASYTLSSPLNGPPGVPSPTSTSAFN
jgi:hypothetical protein